MWSFGAALSHGSIISVEEKAEMDVTVRLELCIPRATSRRIFKAPWMGQDQRMKLKKLNVNLTVAASDV